MSPAGVGASASLTTWLCFLAMCLGMFMAILDIQIVVTSLPAIASSLGIPESRMSWIQTTYLVAEVVAIPLTGVLTRALSLRGLFLIAIAVFTVASVACAMATGFDSLVAARAVQGLAGGCLIPLVFSSVFLLFPVRQQGVATTIAGALAVLAPTLGPVIGGYITETATWPWLFLVNVGPGIVAFAVAARFAPRTGSNPALLRQLDWMAVVCLAVGLGALEIALKDAPAHGWTSPVSLALLATFAIAAAGFFARSLRHAMPVVDLRLMADRNFSIACASSFLFGIGLFSAVYLMSVFLALVRDHGPLTIGTIMLVTGATQLFIAPLVVQLELRYDARYLTALGFGTFAVGLAMSGWQTRMTDFDEMFGAQVVRGVGIMLCLIPPTRLALGMLPAARVPDGSALFNLMRNLGGAIGIALVDTVIWQRTGHHANALADKLRAADPAAAKFVGIPLHLLPAPGRVPTAEEVKLAEPLVKAAGLTMAINEAWLLVAAITAVGLLIIPFAKRQGHTPVGSEMPAKRGGTRTQLMR